MSSSGATKNVSDANFDAEVLYSSARGGAGIHVAPARAREAAAPPHKMVAAKVRIQAMPTLMIFKNGEVAAQRVGALVQKKQLQDWINGSI